MMKAFTERFSYDFRNMLNDVQTLYNETIYGEDRNAEREESLKQQSKWRARRRRVHQTNNNSDVSFLNVR